MFSVVVYDWPDTFQAWIHLFLLSFHFLVVLYPPSNSHYLSFLGVAVLGIHPPPLPYCKKINETWSLLGSVGCIYMQP